LFLRLLPPGKLAAEALVALHELLGGQVQRPFEQLAILICLMVGIVDRLDKVFPLRRNVGDVAYVFLQLSL
jgi:hypothetical protein